MVPTISSADESYPSGIVEASLKRRKNNDWDVHDWRSFLAKHDVDFQYNDKSIKSGDDGVSTQNFQREETTLHITYVEPRYSSDDLIDFEWEFYADDVLSDDGNYPLDNMAIGYDNDHYTRTRSLHFDEYGSHITDMDSLRASGSVIEWNDYDAFQTEEHNSGYPFKVRGYYGEYVQKNWEDFDEYERKVYVDLHHTWGPRI